MAKLLEATEVRALHEGVGHGLKDEGGITKVVVVYIVQANEGLQETYDDNEQQRKENDRLFHHDLQYNQHGTEEAETVEVEQQTHPEHRGTARQKIVAQDVQLFAPAALGSGGGVMSEGSEAKR